MPYPQIWMKVEKLANDKHSSLLRKVVNYGFKKFYNIGLWMYFTHNKIGLAYNVKNFIPTVKKFYGTGPG